jgi:hypothetical protein
MLTGQLLYYDSNPYAIAMMHIQAPVPDILAVNPQLPLACRNIMQKALAKNRDARYQTCSDLAQDLSKIANTTFIKSDSTPKFTASYNPNTIAYKTQTLTLNVMKQAEQMTTGQVVIASMAVIITFLLATVGLSSFIQANFPQVWVLFTTFYYIPALLAYPITQRRGVAFAIQATLHILIIALTWGKTPDIIYLIVSGVFGGLVLEASFWIPEIPNWLRMPMGTFIAFILSAGIIYGGNFSVISGPMYIGTILVGLIAYFLSEVYRGVRKAKAERELQTSLGI